MLNKFKSATIALSLAALVVPLAYSDHINHRNGIRRILLISIDGMHALDYENCVSGGYCPNLAALGKNGVNYTRTSASRPSDSFPGFLAQVTGGTPKSTGVFYDDSFDRTYFAPDSNCAGAPGAEVAFAENIDVDDKQLNAGGTPGEIAVLLAGRESAGPL